VGGKAHVWLYKIDGGPMNSNHKNIATIIEGREEGESQFAVKAM